MAKRRKGPNRTTAATPADPLETMVRAVDRREMVVRDLDRDLARAVYLARRYDVTWEDIGKRFGITRQAAHQRWSKYELGS
jgi:phage-related baseplate assembly protein